MLQETMKVFTEEKLQAVLHKGDAILVEAGDIYSCGF
jgi:hypothetical protein